MHGTVLANVPRAGVGVGRRQWGAPDEHRLLVADRGHEGEALLALFSVSGWGAVPGALAVVGAGQPLCGAVGAR